MKSVAIPAIRVPPESSQAAFVERGLASARASRKSGKYVPAKAVFAKLSRRLAKARKRRTPST